MLFSLCAEQQHIEANLKAAVAGVYIMMYFHDEEEPCFCDLNLNKGTINSADVHYVATECRDILFDMQVTELLSLYLFLFYLYALYFYILNTIQLIWKF